jgi:hypothetical protein
MDLLTQDLSKLIIMGNDRTMVKRVHKGLLVGTYLPVDIITFFDLHKLLALPAIRPLVLSGVAPNRNNLWNAGFFGDDSFTFKVNDGHADSSA